jgi:hypothetical protein
MWAGFDFHPIRKFKCKISNFVGDVASRLYEVGWFVLRRDFTNDEASEYGLDEDRSHRVCIHTWYVPSGTCTETTVQVERE